jgi:hypothetical protein
MIESQYTSNVNQRVPEKYKCWKINDDYQGGVPDSFYMNPDSYKRNLWIEYKFIKSLPKRGSTIIVPALSSLQIQWLANLKSAGEQTLVIVGIEKVKGRTGAQGIILEPHEFGGIRCHEAALRLKDYKAISSFIINML